MSAAAATLYSLLYLLIRLLLLWVSGWLAAPAAAKSGWNFEFPNGLQSLLNLDTLLRHMSRSHQSSDLSTYLHAYIAVD